MGLSYSGCTSGSTRIHRLDGRGMGGRNAKVFMCLKPSLHLFKAPPSPSRDTEPKPLFGYLTQLRFTLKLIKSRTFLDNRRLKVRVVFILQFFFFCLFLANVRIFFNISVRKLCVLEEFSSNSPRITTDQQVEFEWNIKDFLQNQWKYELTVLFKHEMIGKHFTETSNKVELRINRVQIKRGRPVVGSLQGGRVLDALEPDEELSTITTAPPKISVAKSGIPRNS